MVESQLKEHLKSESEVLFDRVALYHYGVPSIGVSEHVHILPGEALATRLERVVLCIFIGNDIHEGHAVSVVKAKRYAIQEWLAWKTAKLVLNLAISSSLERRAVSNIGHSDERLGEAPPYVRAVALEILTFSQKRFLEILPIRAEATNPNSRRIAKHDHPVLEGLASFRDPLGDKLVVLPLPDKFQVNDALYDGPLNNRPPLEASRRELPQERILAFCQQNRIACADFLPALREAQRDGRTCHLEETHHIQRQVRLTISGPAACTDHFEEVNPHSRSERWCLRRARHRRQSGSLLPSVTPERTSVQQHLPSPREHIATDCLIVVANA